MAPVKQAENARILQAPGGADLARGVCRGLYHLGYTCLTEFKLTSRRRVDVIGIDASGAILIVEIKSSIEDFRADRKWQEYLAFCDRFFFAVGQGFPREVLPTDCGLLIADPYAATVIRDAPLLKLNAARRRAQTLRFAHTAAQRLTRLTDPAPLARPMQASDPNQGMASGKLLL